MGLVLGIIGAIEASEAIAGAVVAAEAIGEVAGAVAETSAIAAEVTTAAAETTAIAAEATEVAATAAEVVAETTEVVETEALLAEADTLITETDALFATETEITTNTGEALLLETDEAIAQTEQLLATDAGAEAGDLIEVLGPIESEVDVLDPLAERSRFQQAIDFIKENGLDIYNAASTASNTYQNIHHIFDEIADQERSHEKPVKDLLFTGPNGSIVDVDHLLNGIYTYKDPYQMGYNTGKILSGAIQRFHHKDNESIKELEAKLLVSILESAQTNRKYNQDNLAKKLYTYLRNSKTFINPEDIEQEYTKIRQVFDGQIAEAFYDEDGNISVIDELGIKRSWTEGMFSKVKGKKLLIPTLHGNFVGPLSKNDDLPIDLLDTYALLHDIAYGGDNVFHSVADLQFVSRIEQNLHRMSGKEYYVAKFAAKWFSTAGIALQSLTEDKQHNFTLGGEGNFYNYLLPQTVTERYMGKPRRGLSRLRNYGETAFRAGLQEAMDEGFYDFAALGQGPQSSNILEALGDLKVVEICS